MKKRLLSFFMATAAVAVYAQPMFYVNDVDVKVEENTLVYIGGDFEKTSTVANNGVVTNDGNMYVDGDFTNASSEDFFLLTNKDGDNSTYGQLIIDDAATVSGKISLTRKLLDGQDFIQISFPFSDVTGTSVLADMGLTNGNFPVCPAAGACGGRYISSLLYWSNDEVLFENVNDGSANLDPSLYYILNESNRHTDAGGKLVTITGTPHAGALSISLTAMNDIFDPEDRNKYTERYASYQEDIVLGEDTSDSNWGENQYQFANPYTSNLDISFIGFNESGTLYENDGNALAGLEAAAFFGAATAIDGDDRDSELTGTVIGFDSSTGQKAVGDVANAFVLEPTIPFILKFDATNPTQSLALGDANKVFSDIDRAVDDVDGNENKSASSSIGNSINQLGIAVYNGEERTNNRFYVAVSDKFVDTQRSRMELGTSMPKNGLYTIQEAIDGSVRQDQVSNPLFVNGISNSFVGVAIPVGLNIDEDNPQTTYTLKTSFRSEDGIVLEEGIGFNTGQDFIFHDKELGEIVVMDDDFEYTFTQLEDTNTRFEIFYGEVPSLLNTLNPVGALASTKVYKKAGESYAIRFSEEQLGETANVSVYNAVGQLVSISNGVSTNEDYDLNLSKDSSSLYIVKIEGKNGTIVSQKIIR